MVITRIVTLLGDRDMDRNIRNHSQGYELLQNKRAHQSKPLPVIQLVRQCNIDLARKLSIAPYLHSLNPVPKNLSIEQPGSTPIWRKDLCVKHTASPAKVGYSPLALIL